MQVIISVIWMDYLVWFFFFHTVAYVLRFMLLERHRRHLGRVSFAFEGTADQAKGLTVLYPHNRPA